MQEEKLNIKNKHLMQSEFTILLYLKFISIYKQQYTRSKCKGITRHWGKIMLESSRCKKFIVIFMKYKKGR